MKTTTNPSNHPPLSVWLESARLRTIPLSIAGALAAAGLAWYYDAFSLPICILMILTAASLQVLSDYANDYGDFSKGTDNEDRLGPQRAMQQGHLNKQQMKRMLVIVASFAFLSGIALLLVSFGVSKILLILGFVVLGLAAIGAAINYTVGAGAYGYKALGDVVSFIFFGLVAVLGGLFLYTKTLPWPAIFPAVGIGLLTAGVLNVNNMRDVENDEACGKITLAVKLGLRGSKVYHSILVIGGIVCFAGFAMATGASPIAYIYMLGAIPLLVHLQKMLAIQESGRRSFDTQLKPLALSTFLISVLFAVFINLG